METVQIDGAEYVKASVLAKHYKYTTDYIGQLCRGRKVDARLIGRTWYVTKESVDNHKNSRYAELRSNEKMQNKSIKTTSSRINVEPTLSKKLLKTQSAAPASKHFINHILWKPASYATDEADLLPPVQKQSADQGKHDIKLPIELAEAERVSIKETSTTVHMHSEPLPAIALGGTLKIRSLDEAFETEPEYTVENTSHIASSASESIDTEAEDFVESEEEVSSSHVEVEEARKLVPKLVSDRSSSHTGPRSSIKTTPKFTKALSAKEAEVISGYADAYHARQSVGPVSRVTPASLVVPVHPDPDPVQSVPISFALVGAVAVLCIVLLGGVSMLESVTLAEAGTLTTSYTFELPKMNFLANIFSSEL